MNASVLSGKMLEARWSSFAGRWHRRAKYGKPCGFHEKPEEARHGAYDSWDQACKERFSSALVDGQTGEIVSRQIKRTKFLGFLPTAPNA
jgi:hypothetical protein